MLQRIKKAVKISTGIATGLVWDSTRNGVQLLKNSCRKASSTQKIVCCLMTGLLLALFASKDLNTYIDTTVLLFIYMVWMVFCLPEIYKRLTFKLFRDAFVMLGYIFFADVIIFSVYRTARRYIDGYDSTFELMNQRAYIFFMNFLRIFAVLLCVLRSIPAYLRRKWREQKKKSSSTKKKNASK